MKWLIAGLLCLCGMFLNTTYAQSSLNNHCSAGKIKSFQPRQKITVASPDENKYDLLHIHLDVAMDNNSVAIAGRAVNTIKALEDNFALYVFELTADLQVDSVIINGQRQVVKREGDVVNVLLSQLKMTGDIIPVYIYYHGKPPGGSVFFFQSGLNNAADETWNAKVTYTLSEPYTAKGWYPCKQSLQDKVDSADIWITVPDTLMAGSNGVLQQVSDIAPGYKRYEWKTKYPTAYYLLSIAVANYHDYSFDVVLPGNISVKVQNFVYNRPGFLDSNKTKIDSVGLMLQYFSELFGTYPFANEKYGHCMSPVFGGMEHQTMTTLHNFNSPVVAHELAHQWFGDNVTCATWRDIWLNEGFATYAEYLFAEKFWTKEHATAKLDKIHSLILDDTMVGGSVYVPFADTVSPYRIFDSRLTYNKGGAVLHMLRYMVNDDARFFSMLQAYQQAFKTRNATTENFKIYASRFTSLDLNDFFAQWIYGEGYPVYDVRWNQVEDKVHINLKQSTAVPSSVALYTLPVELKFTTAKGDTTIRWQNNSNEQEYVFSINAKVNDVLFDPDNWILNKETVLRDFTIGAKNSINEVTIYPNPARTEWVIAGLQAGSELYLTDISGRIVWKADAIATNGYVVPAVQFSGGMYILSVIKAGERIAVKKLIKL